MFASTHPLYAFHSGTDPDLVKCVNVENGFSFAIAKDSMGTQICHAGKFYPDRRDFGTIDAAVEFLNQDDNLPKAEEFFRTSPEPTMGESLFAVMMGFVGQEIALGISNVQDTSQKTSENQTSARGVQDDSSDENLHPLR